MMGVLLRKGALSFWRNCRDTIADGGTTQVARRDWHCEDVLSGEIEVQTVYEDERVLASHHPRPASEVDAVVVLKEHLPGVLDPKALDGDLLTSMLQAIQHTAPSLGLDDRGFYVRVNAARLASHPICIGTGSVQGWDELARAA